METQGNQSVGQETIPDSVSSGNLFDDEASEMSLALSMANGSDGSFRFYSVGASDGQNDDGIQARAAGYHSGYRSHPFDVTFPPNLWRIVLNEGLILLQCTIGTARWVTKVNKSILEYLDSHPNGPLRRDEESLSLTIGDNIVQQVYDAGGRFWDFKSGYISEVPQEVAGAYTALCFIMRMESYIQQRRIQNGQDSEAQGNESSEARGNQMGDRSGARAPASTGGSDRTSTSAPNNQTDILLAEQYDVKKYMAESKVEWPTHIACLFLIKDNAKEYKNAQNQDDTKKRRKETGDILDGIYDTFPKSTFWDVDPLRKLEREEAKEKIRIRIDSINKRNRGDNKKPPAKNRRTS